ncbi:hypothetical protein [Cohnella sp. WQ 127256]|uniref:hypothetical protein n=1 Tax=Cohnella sp. WQ 127256 TaxID=2938790 RepID=UPI0021188F1F|nr:hypothetical protein [Cohnella sp. WQ 127256]
MFGSIFVVLVALMISVIELPSLIRKRWSRETLLYLLLLITGTTLSVLAIRLTRISSPLNFLISIYKPLIDWFAYFFH